MPRLPRPSATRLLAAVLAAGALLLVAADAVAQTLPTGDGSSTTTQLVTTECKLGQVTVCGKVPATTTCSYKWSFEINRVGGSLSVSFGGQECTSTGEVNLYKDFYQNGSTGVCTTFPRTTTDATRTGSEDGGTIDDGTC